MAMAEVTFTVHPRPSSDEAPPDDGLAAVAVLSLSEPPIEAPKTLASSHDTVFGDLMFLMRYAFGRY